MVPPHATACQFYFCPSPCCSTGPTRPLRPSLGVTLVLHVFLRPSMCTPGMSPGLTHSWDTGVWKQGSEPLRRAAGIRLLPPMPLLHLCLAATHFQHVPS